MGPKDRNDGSAEINPCRRHDSTYRRALRMGDDELDSELDSTNRRACCWQFAGLDRLNMGILLFVTVVLFRRQSSKSVLLMKFNLLFLGSMVCTVEPIVFPQGMTVCTVMPIVLVDNGLRRPSLLLRHSLRA
jgi:hypothetical protein